MILDFIQRYFIFLLVIRISYVIVLRHSMGLLYLFHNLHPISTLHFGQRSGSVVEHQTPEGKVGGSKPTSAILCP